MLTIFRKSRAVISWELVFATFLASPKCRGGTASKGAAVKGGGRSFTVCMEDGERFLNASLQIWNLCIFVLTEWILTAPVFSVVPVRLFHLCN